MAINIIPININIIIIYFIGYKLGSDANDSVYYGSTSEPKKEKVNKIYIYIYIQSRVIDKKIFFFFIQVKRMITFWKNGFSIDDGPLMDYKSHQNVLKNLEEG